MRKKFFLLLFVGLLGSASASANQLPISQIPLFVGSTIPPHVMINMSVDSQLFFSAFPEFADLSGDGAPDRGYMHSVDYFGYFDSYKCYTYSTTDNRFVPHNETEDKFCPGAYWSGNFLNWVTMARIDTVRAILYGGKRKIDDEDLTVLERTYLPTDAHSWVKFYDGEDLNGLTPYTQGVATTVASTSQVTIARPPLGERNNDTYRRDFAVPGWTSAEVQLGDQVEIQLQSDPAIRMLGVVRTRNLGTNPAINVQVTSSEAPESLVTAQGPWTVVNRSRRGVSFCNTTVATGASHGPAAIGAPPLMRVARGDYSLWTANERWQCLWSDEKSGENLPPARMHIGNIAFRNGNDITASGLWANSTNPVRGEVGLGNNNYQVFVEVCREGLVGTERCRAYGEDEILKPIGLLQEFGEDGRIRFGLMTGSFTNHVSGGVLRKNMGTFGDEVDPDSGEFTHTETSDSIVRSLDALRIFGYSHDSGEYTAGAENCVFGTSKSQMVGGRCFSWGNPQAEIFAESLRYLAGLTPNPAFTHSGNDRIPGLRAAAWNNPITEDLWCTPKTIIQFNASVTSFDNNAAGAASGLPAIGSVDNWTNQVGTGEGLAGATVFAGGSTGFCAAETLGNLADFIGICPEAPNQDGTYHIAGLAYYAYTADLRPDWQGEQTVRTIGVSLAPAVPRIEIPRPGQSDPAVIILPACDNQGQSATNTENLRCQLADFRIIDQDLDAGTGSFFIQWDVSEWGADFDSDLNGTLTYQITENQIEITTETWTDSSGRRTGFGYIISGTTQDGFHAHSGINGYTRPSGNGALGCNNCVVSNPPTSWTYQLGGGTAELLREPLFYAAKWGGYDKNREFPNDPLSWDTTGDGLPDNYFFAIDPAQLFVALRRAFQRVIDAIETTTLETTTSRLETGTLVYQAGFDTRGWVGDIVALDPFLPPTQRLRWSATQKLSEANIAWSSRSIFTNLGRTGQAFSPSMDPELIRRLFAGVEALQSSADCPGLDADRWFCKLTPEQLINFLRGDLSNSQSNGGRLRDRDSLVGDIVGSQIVLSPVAGRGNEGWGRLGGQIGSAYLQFLERKLNRVEDDLAAVFVGSNNGMLHAFDAIKGDELFAFVPSAVFEHLHTLADPSYQHRFFVDGRLSVADAYLPDRGGWRTILVGALGAGGKGLFALDVTTPESFNPATDVLWELTPESPGAANLGHVFGVPTITRLGDHNGTFVAIVGNGYNAASNAPSLLVIRLNDGQVLQEFAPSIADAERPDHNGLSATSILLDAATRTFVSRVYAGDLSGRMWRFDFNETGQITSHRLLFRASVGEGNNELDQAITAAPNVTTSVEGGLNVFFGTGRFFVEGDNLKTEPVQSFYMLRDVGQGSTLARSNLGQARISRQTAAGREVLVDSFNANGWFLDLIGPDNVDPGERVIARPEIIAGRVIFSTFQPTDRPCDGGGVPRLYVLDAGSGAGVLGNIAGIESEFGTGVPIVGVGAPLNPPVVIAPPPPPDPGDFDQPFRPVEFDDEGNPIPPEIPPSGDGLDRSAWCARVGFLNPNDQQFNPLAALCDGRQVWRQIW